MRGLCGNAMRIGIRISQAARRTLLVVLGLVIALGSASAQTPDLVTDRPDQTESATVVLRGLVQVETGYLFAREDGIDAFEVPGTLFRIGLGARTELRVGHAGVIGTEGRHGAGDSEVGAKVNLIETADGWTPELAILGGVSLPTGDEAFSSDGVDPSFLVAFAHELSPRLSVGYNVGAAWESSPDQPDRGASLLYSLALGMGVTDRLGAFLEVFGDRRTTGDTATGVSIDGGLTFLLTDVMQVDLYVGKGLRGPTPSSAPASASASRARQPRSRPGARMGVRLAQTVLARRRLRHGYR